VLPLLALDRDATILGVPLSLVRFGSVGLLTNGILLTIYAGATALGVDRHLAVALSFALGMILSFLLNKGFAFRFKGAKRGAFVRYLAVYGLALAVDMALLELLVSEFGVPHVLAQGILIVVIALGLYVALDRLVFPRSTAAPTADVPSKGVSR